MKDAGMRGKIDLHPVIPDVHELSFDDKHINEQRKHNVSEEEAKRFIQNAKFSTTKWNGRFTNYYSDEGSAFVDNETNNVKTAFKEEQYDDSARKAMEVYNRGRP